MTQSDAAQAEWEIWIDRGGTFTDIIGRAPDGELKALKLLSNSEAYEDAATEGVRRLLGVATGAPLPQGALAAVKMGTTVATNALLELDGAKTLFLVTRGFGDILIIGDQTRPDIFALEIKRPSPLPAQTVEVGGRITTDGQDVEAFDAETVKAALETAYADGFESVAIAFMNAHANDAHEQAAAALAREAGFTHITCSSEASPLIKLVPRASTAVIDAYLEPVLRDYVGRVDRGLEGAPLYFMQSGGGLSSAQHFKARNAVLSGPAGGVVGMALTAKSAGHDKVIGFDMGGTSTDVSRFDGESYSRTDMASLDGRVLRAPMLSVHTVAAGGGSVLDFDGERARVGPRSAGADPGPACYGRGGPAAVTDANVVLGRIQPDWFPQVFGPNHDGPLDVDAARTALGQLADKMGLDSPEAAAEGFLSVAIEAMADAIKQISTAQGVDPRGYALNAFGGAGGQHACKVAEALGMRTALIHPKAGLLSAYGIGLAPLRDTRQAGLEIVFDEDGLAATEQTLAQLEDEALASLKAQHARDIRVSREVRIRVQGSDTALPVAWAEEARMRRDFDAAHSQLFGFTPENAVLILDSASADAEGAPAGAPSAEADLGEQDGDVTPRADALMHIQGERKSVSVYDLADLGAGAQVQGPALIMDANQTIVLDPGWRADRLADGMLVLTHDAAAPLQAGDTRLDPIRLELFNRRFMSIAEQMGVVLERTAHSVNIKERLDFSCAVFDAEGGLVANAPHMPVHLGSMSASVRAAVDAHPDLGPGDAVAVNAPYNGGTHLPDVTVIQPVSDETGERMFYVASRGHHADIGGIAPGSMPPFSKTIDEEGVIFDSVKILSEGRFEEDAVRQVLASGAYPARNPAQNIADLKAQLAACSKGAAELTKLNKSEGTEVVRAYMGHVQDNAERAVRRVIEALKDGEAEMRLEDGAVIRVKISVDQTNRTAVIDFTGTSEQRPSNFNAPSAVTRAAVLYVLRCLVDDAIPLNEGCLKPITLIVPEGSLLNPVPPAAVVAGNVETSQLVVDALFMATGRMACAQGTMNNFTFGDETRQYYETICGGAGAGYYADGTGFAGASAVHTHMTNSRLTDPEVLEARYPVRVITHAVRSASGGAGALPGGDGSIRKIMFLEPMQAALLSGRRTEEPAGLNNAQPGEPGDQRLWRTDGSQQPLDALFRIDVNPGEIIEILTPGGGGAGESIK